MAQAHQQAFARLRAAGQAFQFERQGYFCRDRESTPDKPVFKEVGDAVKVGDVIGLIEVMKSFNEVAADQAGTITKRHSATRLQFARFGGACPLWNVHRAFETPGQFLRQLAETPDGVRYLCLARDVSKPGGAFLAPIKRYAIGLGCEVQHAAQLVYADGLDLLLVCPCELRAPPHSGAISFEWHWVVDLTKPMLMQGCNKPIVAVGN